ncbi:hypothetical protein D3C72_2589260 [compost metagenome]
MLSVDAVQPSVALFAVFALSTRFVGAVGGCVSVPVSVVTETLMLAFDTWLAAL